jgi:hypothetical protein
MLLTVSRTEPDVSIVRAPRMFREPGKGRENRWTRFLMEDGPQLDVGQTSACRGRKAGVDVEETMRFFGE